VPEEPVRIPVETTIDLHTFKPEEIRSLVEEYLNECVRMGFSEVRIVHGKGRGIQRQIVRSICGKHPNVFVFKDAPPERGGKGATVVFLSSHSS
jgi:DNA-nicking Smr family endonuclease